MVIISMQHLLGTARTTRSESCISIRDPFLSTSPSFSASSKWLLFLSIPIILKQGIVILNLKQNYLLLNPAQSLLYFHLTLSIASLIIFLLAHNEKRIYPSPFDPKTVPGVTKYSFHKVTHQ